MVMAPLIGVSGIYRYGARWFERNT